MKTKLYLFIFLLPLFLNSCSRYHYSPDDGNMLAVRSENDIHLSAGWNSGRFKDSSNHFNFQVAYSPIKHLGITNSFFYKRDYLRNDNTGSGEGHIWNGAIGGYYELEKFGFPRLNTPWGALGRPRRSLPRVIEDERYFMRQGNLFEFYLGHSFGVSHNYYSNGRGFADVNFRKTYGQFGWHWFNDLGGLSYTFKFGQLNFVEASSFGPLTASDLDRLKVLENKSRFFVRESTVRFHFGVRHARCFFNITVLKGHSDLDLLGVDNSNFGMGVIIEIDEFFRGKSRRGEITD